MKVTKATQEEKDNYDGMYDLYGFITVEGKQCAVEKLPRKYPDDPRYEVLSPAGHHFDNYLHSLICEDLADLYERIQYVSPIGACSTICGIEVEA